METQTEEPKQSPNQTTTTKTDKETRQDNTTDLLNPMAGYDHHTHPPTRILILIRMCLEISRVPFALEKKSNAESTSTP